MYKYLIWGLIFFPFPILAQKLYQPLQIPVRDGKFLAADLYSSDTNRQKSVILIQTPYNKIKYRLTIKIQSLMAPMPYDSVNYNYVIVDWRGFYGSIAAASPTYDRGMDGYDVVEWIAKQRWSNGKIGTYGASALGMIQFQTARFKPPHLVCAMPMEKDFKTKYSDFYYGGNYRKEHVESLDSLGLTQKEIVLAHPTRDISWQYAENQYNYVDSFNIPMLLASGWFDHYPEDVLRAFNDICSGGNIYLRTKHKLVFGPWLHSSIGQAQQGELTYNASVGLLDTMASRFFSHYLLNRNNSYDNFPTMSYYVMGKESWENTSAWNSVGIYSDSLFLDDQKMLSGQKPTQSTHYDSLIYNPKNPSPSYGGSRFNPFDASVKTGPLDISTVVESRNDNLVYTTAILTNALKIRGSLQAKLFVASNRTDTDFGIRLCDVYPDGRSMLLTQGIKRGRFRNSYSTQTLMVPGQIYPLTVELSDLGIDILPGHRLRIIITSANYPMFDLNLNNGSNMYVAGDSLTAVNYIFTDASHPSCLVFKSSEPASSVNEFLSNENSPQLRQNFPNPFSTSTTVSFFTVKQAKVVLRITDIFGNEISRPLDGFLTAGNHQLMINAADLKAGFYFYSLETEAYKIVRKMMIVK